MIPREAVARTAWGEADMQGIRGMHAVINTAVNRLNSGVRWWGRTLDGICLFKYQEVHQYSCWNLENRRLAAIRAVDETNPLYAEALRLADLALVGKLPDITNGATHYYNHMIVKTPPRWARQAPPVFKLEPHWFYRVLN